MAYTRSSILEEVLNDYAVIQRDVYDLICGCYSGSLMRVCSFFLSLTSLNI
jgi:hypothetical protein